MSRALAIYSNYMNEHNHAPGAGAVPEQGQQAQQSTLLDRLKAMPIDPGPTHEPSAAEVERAKLLELLDNCRVHYYDPIPENLFIYEYGGLQFFPFYGIVGLKAQSKAGKTFAMSAFAAAALTGGDWQGLRWLGRENARVLYIDTEQDHITTTMVVRRIINAAMGERAALEERLVTVNFLEVPTKDQWACLEYEIERVRPALTIIDGIADFANGEYNDEGLANDLMKFLRTLAKRYDTAILTAIHTNKKDDHSTGWLGKRLLNKCDLEYMLDATSNVRKLKPTAERNGPAPTICFSIDQTPDRLGKVTILSDDVVTADAEEKTKEQIITDFRLNKLSKFECKRQCDFVRELQNPPFNWGERKAKDVVKDAARLGILIKTKHPNGSVFLSFPGLDFFETT